MSLSSFDFLPTSTYSYIEVKEAYDAIMDSMVFLTPFSEGVLPYSESAKEHFLDCQKLFLLNNIVFLISLVIFIVFSILKYRNIFKNISFKGISFKSIFSFLVLAFLLVLVIYCFIDEDAAFTFFHSILFPGKTNWIFSPFLDPIINYFTMDFFLFCGGSIFIIFVGLLLINLIKEIIFYKRSKKEENINKLAK